MGVGLSVLERSPTRTPSRDLAIGEDQPMSTAGDARLKAAKLRWAREAKEKARQLKIQTQRKSVLTGQRVMRKGHPQDTPVPVSELAGSLPGQQCPRPHCGGLLVERSVVTHDGVCMELVCASCARSAVVKILEPYPPLRVSADPNADRFFSSREDRAAQDSDDSMGIALPHSVLASVDTPIASED